MSHKIEQHDKQEGTFVAWHGLTEVNPNLNLKSCWLSQWDIIKKKMVLEDGTETPFSLLTASDNNKIQIGVPFADSYFPITNEAFLNCIENAVMGISGLKLTSVGSIMNRNRVFVSFEVGEANFTHGERDFESYLNFGNAHDKGSPFWSNTSNTCVVCANTYGMNLRHNSKNINIKIRHTKNAELKLENVEELVNGAIGAQKEFKAIFESIDEVKTNPREAQRVFAGFLGQGKELSTRGLNSVNRLTELFLVGKGNKGETRADIFSAVTDFYSHESSGGDNRMKQWVSSEFGSASNKKRDFMDVLTNGFEDAVKAGELSLSLS